MPRMHTIIETNDTIFCSCQLHIKYSLSLVSTSQIFGKRKWQFDLFINKFDFIIFCCSSLKRKRCNDGKYNFLERLLGVTCLLSQMVEPMLKAAIEISTLLARSFFMKFSLTTLAVLARVRVIVQQTFLSSQLYNIISSLSQREQTVKSIKERSEVLKEYNPRKEEATMSKRQEMDGQEDVLLNASKIRNQNIEVLLGVDEAGTREAEHVSADPNNAEQNVNDSGVNNDEKLVLDASDTAKAPTAHTVPLEDVLSNSSAAMVPETNSQKIAGLTGSSSSSLLSNPLKLKNGTKKVAFVSGKPSAPSAKQMENLKKDERKDKERSNGKR
ncbi:hypothetical protein Pfo_013619 [Paulownia fortunei]|nr:hypothetical protein Pfo_013619 [Paulownia fortunei]